MNRLITHVCVCCELVPYALELSVSRDGDEFVHDVVLFEEVGQHLGGA